MNENKTATLKKELKEAKERLIRYEKYGIQKPINRVKTEIKLIEEVISYIENLERPVKHGGYSDSGICLEFIETEDWKNVI